MSMVAKIKKKSGTIYSVEVWADGYDESEVVIERPSMKKSILRSIDPVPRLQSGRAVRGVKKITKGRRRKRW